MSENIQSNETIAGRISEQMSQAATHLISGQAPTTLAEKTTVTGNGCSQGKFYKSNQRQHSLIQRLNARWE